VSVSATRPLSTLLSQVLIAFTIEFDNEAERELPHTTTIGRARGATVRGPWLVSLVMWANFMRFVDANGRPLRELAAQARTVNLRGLQRWGYIKIGPPPEDPRPAPPRGEMLVRTTRWGALAQRVWEPLDAVVESAWAERFGAAEIAELRGALVGILSQIELELPPFMPVAGVHRNDPERWLSAPARGRSDLEGLELYTLLAQVLLAFERDYERQSRLSLAISANVLRVLGSDGVRVAALPLRSGVSKEAIAVSLGLLERAQLAVIEPDPGAARAKQARLTEKGRLAQEKYLRLIAATQAAWRERFGDAATLRLRRALEDLIDRRKDGRPLLTAGLVPAPGSWRALKPFVAQTEAVLADAGALAHHPMVSHRGGYPDGS
jgi:DNA-binding MarR family transcriptional regulator